MEQAARKLSIPSQIEQLKRYAEQNNIILMQVYKEEHSAYKGKRPVFHEMLEELSDNQSIDGLLIFKRDRISRNLDDFNSLEKITRDKGVEVISVTEPMLNSYLGRYMVRDMQNRAILYSEELSFRVKLGIRKRLQQGDTIGGVPPFGFKRVGKYLVPDEDKSPVVHYVFETYATGEYGYKSIAEQVRKKFGLKTFYSKIVETMIKNTLYIGINTVKRTLSHEEYLFWGLDKPGTIHEQYEMKYMTPLIEKDLFERCQHIRKMNDHKQLRTGTSRYPKIFGCICGRNLRRDDKKNLRYLSCPKKISNKHPIKCKEGYTQIARLDTSVEEIVRGCLLTAKQRTEMKALVKNKIESDTHDKHYQIKEHVDQITILQSRLDDITETFVEGEINKSLYQQSALKVNEKITGHKNEIKLLEDDEAYIEAGKKTIKFLEILDRYESLLVEIDENKKSSHLYSTLFKVCANLTIGGGNIRSHQYFELFDIASKGTFGRNWVVGGSNPGPAD